MVVAEGILAAAADDDAEGLVLLLNQIDFYVQQLLEISFLLQVVYV